MGDLGKRLKYAASRAADFATPVRCALCGKPVGFFAGCELCADCFAAYADRVSELCPRCGEKAGDCRCSDRKFRAFSVKGYASLGFYREFDDEVGRLVYRFKREDDRDLRRFFARSLAAEIMRRYPLDVTRAVLVCPPRSAAAKRKRGFDQSVLLCRQLTRYLGCKFADVIVRVGGSEQKKLDAAKRAENTESSFRLTDDAALVGKDVIVVDDVATTGATLGAVAKIVTDAGAKSVFPAVLFVTENRRGGMMDGKVAEDGADDDDEIDFGF